jgi:hypothetical protein
MFRRKGPTPLAFPREKSIGWLSWLAGKMRKHSLSIFLVEKLQPKWLGTKAQSMTYKSIVTLSRWLGFGLGFGLILALIIGLSFGLGFGLRIGLVSGLILALILALIIEPRRKLELEYIVVDAETLGWEWNRFRVRILGNLVFGSIVGLIAGLILVTILGLIFGLSVRLIALLIYGLIAGLSIGLVIGVRDGFRHTIKADISSPNEGIKLMRQNSLVVFFVISLIAFLIYGLITGLSSGLTSGLRFGLIYGLMAGLSVGIAKGGFDVIIHYALRLILWRSGYTPFNFIKFLDHCAKLILLKKVGGGYIFIHRMLLEYFAELTPEKKSHQRDKITQPV